MKWSRRDIEVWYTDPKQNRRCCDKATYFDDAHHQCIKLAKEGKAGICVDITYYDNDGERIEGMSSWYSFNAGTRKLNKI